MPRLILLDCLKDGLKYEEILDVFKNAGYGYPFTKDFLKSNNVYPPNTIQYNDHNPSLHRKEELVRLSLTY